MLLLHAEYGDALVLKQGLNGDGLEKWRVYADGEVFCCDYLET